MYLPFKKPVLTCKIGEPAEIFGEDGFYFDNAQPVTLAALMIDLFDKPGIKQSINIEEHSWTKRSIDFDNWIKSIYK